MQATAELAKVDSAAPFDCTHKRFWPLAGPLGDVQEDVLENDVLAVIASWWSPISSLGSAGPECWQRIMRLLHVVQLQLLCAAVAVSERVGPLLPSDSTQQRTGRYLKQATSAPQRVNDPSAFPFRAVGALYVAYADGNTAQCSAALVTSNAILTAGHCAWNVETGIGLLPIQAWLVLQDCSLRSSS